MPRKQRFKPSRKPKPENPTGENTATEQSRNPGQIADIETDTGRSQKTEPSVIEGNQETG